ncbi:competence/damage-inducible protein cinA [Lishizhenia tianjinensis]|uniref:CinA-like protein n=1 Tax=Lishizhenia tianjinensis TaxID=477690 RepID=A0A1I6YQ37_9FLAO|nr:competence/damage-inducible protein A [Lishizhenia tianjinensis]SFT52609.1 competence/damage-inducible protein cinA [Lishizhenia tianjinensis]
MRAEIITIGDEILIGQTVDTNSAWMGQLLSSNGISIFRTTSISDTKDEIIAAVDAAMQRSELVLMTGGLGPTKDDITKHTLCEYFDTPLKINQEVLERIEAFFAQRNRPMLEVNVQQAAMPEACTVLPNKQGTASGMWFEKYNSILVSMPGVPYEMKGLMTEEVMPRLQKRLNISAIYHRTLMTQGIGESFLAEQIADWEDKVRAEGFGLAYLPNLSTVKLRLTSPRGEEDATRIEDLFQELEERLPVHVFGRDDVMLEEAVGNLLKDKGITVGAIESCTGGELSAKFVSIAGSSAYYLGSLVTYTDALKQKMVGVQKETLVKHGAVSEQTVIEMAEGGRKVLDTDYAIAISGIAGPDGGTEEKPVGTVWMAIASEQGTQTRCLHLGSNRSRNIQITVQHALNTLRVKVLAEHA